MAMPKTLEKDIQTLRGLSSLFVRASAQELLRVGVAGRVQARFHERAACCQDLRVADPLP
jgi:hypothetical protein